MVGQGQHYQRSFKRQKEQLNQMARAAKKAGALVPELIAPEERAQAAFSGLDRKLAPLTDPILGIVRIKNQADADLLSAVINVDIPNIEKQIFDWFGRDREVSWHHYKSLKEKEDRFGKPLGERLKQYRQLLAGYLFREKQKAIEEAVQKQRAIDEAAPDLGIVVQPKEVKVEGVTPTMRKKHRVVNLLALVKLVAQGKADIECIQADDVYLANKARTKFDTCQVDPLDHSKRWLYKDAVEVYEEPGVSR